MPKSFYACLSAVLVLVMLAFAYGEADAARIGGGRSFGGRPSMSQPYTKPLPSNPSSSFNQQTNRQSQQMANSAAPSRGLFGGMGGMLGGLLAGSLLGSLLFGGGFNGGGFLDIILIGGLLQVLQQTPRRNTGRRTAQCGRFRLAPQHARLRFDAPAYGGSPKRQGRF